MVKAYASGDSHFFPNELEAFQVSFRQQQIRMLLTSGILDEYQKIADKAPQIQLQPILNTLSESIVAISMDESQLRRYTTRLISVPKWHYGLIRDAIRGRAAYLITDWPRWLDIAQQAEIQHGLSIVTPARFVELEG